MRNQKIVVLLGMHRSKTSLTAKWLHANGVNMGDKMLGSNIGNESGHYEDLDFFHLNQEILRYNELPSGGILFENDRTFNPAFENIRVERYHEFKAKALIEFKSKLHKQFGWKDPRTVLLTEFYDKHIPQANYIMVYRHYLESINSLVVRKIRTIKHEYKQLKLGKIRYLIYGAPRVKCIKLKANIYLDAWILYNKKIVELIESKPKDRFVLFSDKDLELDELQNKVLSKMKDWGFMMNDAPLDSVYKENPENSSLRKLQLDLNPQSVAEAEKILKKLQEYSLKV